MEKVNNIRVIRKRTVTGLLLLLLGCTATKHNHVKGFSMENKFVREKGMNIPVLTNEKDKAPSLDVIRYKIKEEAFLPRNEKQPELKLGSYNTFWERIDYDSFSVQRNFEVKEDEDKVKSITEWVTEKEPIDDIDYKYKAPGAKQHYTYKVSRKYYDNGQLKFYNVYLEAPHASSSGFRLGTWYRFDENGSLLQTIDHEKYFKTSYLDVLKTALSYKRNFFEIQRHITAEKSYWRIYIYPMDYEPKPHIYVIIDDETGKIIDELIIDESYKGDEESIRAWLNRYYDAEFQKKTYRPFFD